MRDIPTMPSFYYHHHLSRLNDKHEKTFLRTEGQTIAWCIYCNMHNIHMSHMHAFFCYFFCRLPLYSLLRFIHNSHFPLHVANFLHIFFCCCHFIFTTFYVVCKYVMRNVEARKSIRMIQLIMAHLCHCLNFIINIIINFMVNHIKFSSILIRRLSTHKIIDFPYAL